MRKTDDVIEERGVELTKDLSKEANLVLYLIDSTKGISVEDTEFINEHKKTSSIPLLVVFNKCDSENSKECEKNFKTDYIRISAKKGDGIDALSQKVKSILEVSPHQNETAGLGSQRQKESVSAALERVEHALLIAHSQEFGLDAVVQDLEDSLDSLGEVTGQVTPDDVLSSVFANFCVGK